MSAPRIAHLLQVYERDRVAVVVQPQRIRDTVAHLLPFFGQLTVAEITRSAVLEYTQKRQATGLKSPTVRRELVSLRAALRMAWRDGLIDRVPPLPMPAHSNRRERVLSRDEVRALLAATAPRPRLHAFLRLLIATCGRVSAVCELTWAAVDLHERVIDLRSRHPLAQRMKRRAVVPITSELAAYLAAYRDAPEVHRGRGRRPVPGARVVGLSVSSARQQLKTAALQAGVQGVTPHVIRHSVATHMLAEGVELTMISKMLGHASVAITADVYGHLKPAQLAPAAEVLGRWAG